MNKLENEYPNVHFVYMTGHLDGSGLNGNLHIRNEQIRNYCKNNNKILFDLLILKLMILIISILEIKSLMIIMTMTLIITDQEMETGLLNGKILMQKIQIGTIVPVLTVKRLTVI